MKEKVQSFGRFLSGMVMPNIGAFIAWGLITALFIATGWLPNERLSSMVSPMLSYVLPILIAYTGGKMVGGARGAVMGAIACVGVICGAPDYPMLMGAMLAGPLGGWVIKKFDAAVEGKIPAGFEMLVNNFSVGILGMFLAILGFYLIGPFMAGVLVFLQGGVDILVNAGLLPLVSIFVEPAKVLFLNNAINHGIFTPLGAQQVETLGKSVFYMIETNPGAGAGVLLAYWMFSKDKATKDSAPGPCYHRWLCCGNVLQHDLQRWPCKSCISRLHPGAARSGTQRRPDHGPSELPGRHRCFLPDRFPDREDVQHQREP